MHLIERTNIKTKHYFKINIIQLDKKKKKESYYISDISLVLNIHSFGFIKEIMCIHRNVTYKCSETAITKILTAKARTVDDDGAAVEVRTRNECIVDKRLDPSLNLGHAALRKPTLEVHKLLVFERNEGKDEADSFLAVDC